MMTDPLDTPVTLVRVTLPGDAWLTIYSNFMSGLRWAHQNGAWNAETYPTTVSLLRALRRVVEKGASATNDGLVTGWDDLARDLQIPPPSEPWRKSDDGFPCSIRVVDDMEEEDGKKW